MGVSQSSIAASVGFSDKFGPQAQVEHGVKAAEDRYPGLDPSRMSSKTNLVAIEHQSERIYVPASTIEEAKEDRDVVANPDVSNNGVGRRTNPLGELAASSGSYAAASSNRPPNAAGPPGRGGLSNQSKVKDPFASLDSYDPLA